MAEINFTQLTRRLKDLRQAFLENCRGDVPGLLGARTYAENLLGILRKSAGLNAVPKEDWALVAVGGFGRGDLSFASDLDLLFLYHRKMPQVFQDVIRELIYKLWDAGFEVGHATASVSGVDSMAQEDFSVLTTYLESRYIAGDRDFFTNWRMRFLKNFGAQRRKKFLKNLVTYRNGRMEQFGESSYLLEPQIKEGVGGLRDIHTLRWAATVYLGDPALEAMVREGWFTTTEERWLEQAHDFLWRVRLQLHRLCDRRQDQLLFQEQEQAALLLGFTEVSQGAATEAFMHRYYRHTARIQRTVSFCLDRLGELHRPVFRNPLRKRILPGPFLLEGRHLHFMEPEWITKDPGLIMRFFWQAAMSEANFRHQTGQIIREHLKSFTDAARRDPRVVKQFFEILLHPSHAFTVLKTMLETGFLEAFIPEYSAVRYRTQYDVYHLYTVDVHLLRTVRELHAMEQQTDESLLPLELGDIFVQLENRRVLYLTALLHDIGKGQGKGHSAKGAEMVREIGPRLGLEPREVDLMSFLVANHLILVETALIRDLSDEKPILSCALRIKEREQLRLLYLLSIADSRATGPGAWNTWKASLLRELYLKVDHLLAQGDWKGEDIEKRSREAQEEVLELAGETPDRERIAAWLDSLSLRYILSQPPAAVLEHFRMEGELGSRSLVLRSTPSEGDMWQITVATKDRPGLFALITGVLWAHGLNILSADIFTRVSGVALDVLRVERLIDPLDAKGIWERIRLDLAACLEDRSHLDDLLIEKRKPSILQRKYLPRKDDRVLINEEASDFYTIVEVYTWDRPGILHAMANTFYTLGISIQLAKISTPGAQVADVFYVTDMDGNKLLDPAIHESVREKLFECLPSCCS